MNYQIELAEENDMEDILEVQKKAFMSEAERLQNSDLAPLTQSLENLQQEALKKTVLKCSRNGQVIGSVRAGADEEGICHIGRLVVLPSESNQGIGQQLMTQIEAIFKDCLAYEIFTAADSSRTIHLYGKLGYRITDHVTMDVEMVIMRKTRP